MSNQEKEEKGGKEGVKQNEKEKQKQNGFNEVRSEAVDKSIIRKDINIQANNTIDDLKSNSMEKQQDDQNRLSQKQKQSNSKQQIDNEQGKISNKQTKQNKDKQIKLLDHLQLPVEQHNSIQYPFNDNHSQIGQQLHSQKQIKTSTNRVNSFTGRMDEQVEEEEKFNVNNILIEGENNKISNKKDDEIKEREYRDAKRSRSNSSRIQNNKIVTNSISSSSSSSSYSNCSSNKTIQNNKLSKKRKFSHSSIRQNRNEKNEERKNSSSCSIQNNIEDNNSQYMKVASDQNINLRNNNNSHSKQCFSIFSSLNIPKNEILRKSHHNLSQQTPPVLQARSCDSQRLIRNRIVPLEYSPFSKTNSDRQQHEQQIQKLNSMYAIFEQTNKSFHNGSKISSLLHTARNQAEIEKQPDINNQEKILRQSIDLDDSVYGSISKSLETFQNVYELENPSLNNTLVQQFLIDTMSKVVKSNKEKIFIKKILQRVGLFENQKDIIFKNQSTNETLFNNLNLEVFDKHQVIFHIGEFGSKYFIVVQGGVYLLLPQMGNKEVIDPNKDNVFVNYMSSIQSGYEQDIKKAKINMEFQEQIEKVDPLKLKGVNLYKCSFFLRTIIKNLHHPRISMWAKELGNNQRKITLLFGGLDSEKKQLIKASFLEAHEFVNIFYPGMNLYKTFTPGEAFGEIALLTKQRRTATMLCSEKTYCLSLSKQGFDQIIGAFQKSQTLQQIKFLQQFSFMEKIPNSKLLSIIHDMQKIEYSKGQIVYKEGDSSDYFYFVSEGDFEISKLERIKQPIRIEDNMYKSSQKQLKENDIFSELNWHRQMKKEKREKNRIPIFILSSNTFFGQNEIVRNESKRQTRAVCLSLKGTLFQLAKNILLHHLMNWNCLEELKIQNRVINKWTHNRINQVVELKKSPQNQFQEFFKSPMSKMKKKKKRENELANISINQFQQNESTLSLQQAFMASPSNAVQINNSNKLSLQLSPKISQAIQFQNKKQFQNIFTLQSKISQPEEIYDQASNQEQGEIFDFKFEQISRRDTLFKNIFKQFQPSTSLPHNLDSNSNEGQEDGTQNQVLLKANSINMSNRQQGQSQRISEFKRQGKQKLLTLQPISQKTEQQDMSLSPSVFLKFKQFHERMITGKVLELLEEQKSAEKRRSTLFQNLIEESSQMSQSKLSEHDRSGIQSEDNCKSQQIIDGQTPQRRKQRASQFFTSFQHSVATTGVAQIQAVNCKGSLIMHHNCDESLNANSQNMIAHNQQQTILEEEDNTSIKDHQRSTSKNLQLHSSRSIFHQQPTNQIKRSRTLCSNSLEPKQRLKSHTLFNFPEKDKRKENNNTKRNVGQSKENMLSSEMKISQSQSNHHHHHHHHQYHHLQKNSSLGIVQKQQQKQRESYQQQNKVSTSNNSHSTVVSAKYQDELVQENLLVKHHIIEQNNNHYHHHDNNSHLLLHQEMNKEQKMKEINKQKQSQLLERIKTNFYFNKAGNRSISSDNKYADYLDPKVQQIKELMESSPRIAIQNIKSTLNFKTRFLKIISARPTCMATNLFDFKSNSNKYLKRKTKTSNTKQEGVANNHSCTQSLEVNSTMKKEMEEFINIKNTSQSISNKQLQYNTNSNSNTNSNTNSRSNDNGLTHLRNNQINSIDHLSEHNTTFFNESIPFQIRKFSSREQHERFPKIDAYSTSPLLASDSLENIQNYIMKSDQKTTLKKQKIPIKEKLKLDQSLSQIMQYSDQPSSWKSKDNSFILSPNQNKCSNPRNAGNSISQAIKVVDDDNCKNREKSSDLLCHPIQTEGVLISKMSLLSQRNQKSNNIIQKNFKNQLSHLFLDVNLINKSTHSIPIPIPISNRIRNTFSFQKKSLDTLKNEESFQDKSINNDMNRQLSSNRFQQRSADISKLLPPNLSNLHLKSQMQQNVQNINLSINESTGSIEESQYIASSTLKIRKPFQQRIKEQQIKQKGTNSINCQKNIPAINKYNKQQLKEGASQNANKSQSPSLLNHNSSAQSFFLIDALSNSQSTLTQRQIYHFQGLSPNKLLKKNY